MADVKWIKMKVGMFDGMSFKKIKKAKIGGESFRDKLTAIWFELMDFAGRCNQDGAFISPREIPFTDLSDIATMIDREEEELQLCMGFYVKEGMVTITDDVYSIANWSEYQNTEGLEKIREQNRQRQARFKARKNQALLCDNVTDNVAVTLGNALDKEEDKEKDKESDKDIICDSVEPLPTKKSKPKKEKPPKHKYGEYKNVLLTDSEYERLCAEFGNEFMDKVIQFLDEYIEEKDYKSQSHNLAIRRWVIDAVKEKEAKNKTKSSYTDAISNRVSDVDNW